MKQHSHTYAVTLEISLFCCKPVDLEEKKWPSDGGELGYAAQQPLFSLLTTVYQLMQSELDI